MTAIMLFLPEATRRWAEAEAMSDHHGDIADFVRDLIEREKVRADKIANLNRLLNEPEAEEPSTESMADIRARALRQIQQDS